MEDLKTMFQIVRFRVGIILRLVGIALVFAIILSSAPVPGFAQSTSAILGVVKDSSGGVVPGATVTVRNTATSQTRTFTTGDDGAYRVPALQAGNYEVKIEKAGFQSATRSGLTLDVAQELAVNINLTVGASTQEVVVNAETVQVNTTTSDLGGLVNDAKIADLPLNGRNYIDLTLLQSGISQNRNNASLGGMSGTIFSSNGAPTISNSFLLDGTSIVNQSGWTGSSIAGTTLGVDGIKEYKIITSAFSAEYGMTMGSQMLIVSKGGSNQYHGDLFEYLRNSALDAKNYFDPPRIPQFEKNNFGGSFGGPIKKDKTFFYAVYEQLNIKLGFSVLSNVPPAGCHPSAPGQAIIPGSAAGQCPLITTPIVPNVYTAPYLALYPNPTGGTAAQPTFTFPAPDNQSVKYGQIRVDQNISDSDTLFVRYTTDQSAIADPLAGYSSSAQGGAAFPQWSSSGSSRDHFATVSENHIFSPTLLNTARIAFARTAFNTVTVYNSPTPAGLTTFVAGQPIGTLTVTPFSQLGNTAFVPFHIQNLLTFGDDLYYTHGKHAFKFGTMINHYQDPLASSSTVAGNATYANFTDFLNDIPSQYTAANPGDDFNRDWIYSTLGFYAQDDYRATSKFTLNIGLRYEFMTTPTELNNKGYALRNHGLDATFTQGSLLQQKSLLNFSPRIGFAWDVFGNGKMSVRSAFGIYYDVGNIGNLATQDAATPPLGAQTTVSNTVARAVVPFPFVFTPAQLGKQIKTMVDYNSTQPHVNQFNVTVERQLPGNTTLSVGYVYTRGVHLFTARDGNPGIPAYIAANGTQYWANAQVSCQNNISTPISPNGFCRVNPNFTNDQITSSVGDSWYDALQVSVNKRLSRGLEFQASYTYSHSIDTTEGNLSSADCNAPGMDETDNPQNINLAKGPSCFDLRHNLRFNLLYHLPNIKSDGFVSKFTNGWWMGNVVSVQGGYAFTPIVTNNRSNSGVYNTGVANGERANLGTAAVAPGAIGPDGNANTTTSTFIPFDPNSVILGNATHWFNPLMFTVAPMVPCPGGPFAGQTCGTLGNAPRGLLRGPGLGTWDFSLVKDTALPFLGEAGSLQFRAEFFNILNHANFSMPNGNVFSGSTGTIVAGSTTAANVGAYSQPFLSTAGQITTTTTTSRQIQLALKVIF
jgi:hypothetical protein